MTSPVAELLARPEGRTLDFKRQEVALPKALKTLVAFANTAGGLLVLGVADDKTVVGVDDVLAQEERYASAITDGIEPPLTVDLEIAEHDGKSVLLVRVPRIPGPFYLRSEGPDKGVYVRVGSTNRRATKEQREELRRLARSQAFDQRPCLGATMDDLDTAAIDSAFRPMGRVPDDGAQESLGLATTSGGRRVPTNAGIILFGTVAARRRFFPDAVFRCARFLGRHKATFLDQLDPEGSVLQSLEEVERFVRRNTRMAARIESLRREDVPEYAPVHLREVLVNAVAHADYSQQGMPLRVAVYDDRLEVENPGGWPIGFTEDDFRAGVSRPRNPAIAHVLRELDVMERWGSGYRRIVEASETGGYPLPEWNDLGLVLRTVLLPHPDLHPERDDEDDGREGDQNREGDREDREHRDDVPDDVPVNVPDDVPLNERQVWFLGRIQRGVRITSSDLANQFDVTPKTAKRDIGSLRDANVVRFVGSPRTGRYVITDTTRNHE